MVHTIGPFTFVNRHTSQYIIDTKKFRKSYHRWAQIWEGPTDSPPHTKNRKYIQQNGTQTAPHTNHANEQTRRGTTSQQPEDHGEAPEDWPTVATHEQLDQAQERLLETGKQQRLYFFLRSSFFGLRSSYFLTSFFNTSFFKQEYYT